MPTPSRQRDDLDQQEDDQPVDDEQIDDESVDDESVDDESVDDESVDDEPEEEGQDGLSQTSDAALPDVTVDNSEPQENETSIGASDVRQNGEVRLTSTAEMASTPKPHNGRRRRASLQRKASARHILSRDEILAGLSAMPGMLSMNLLAPNVGNAMSKVYDILLRQQGTEKATGPQISLDNPDVMARFRDDPHIVKLFGGFLTPDQMETLLHDAASVDDGDDDFDDDDDSVDA